MPTPKEALAAGYAASTPPDRTKRRLADTWSPDAHREALAKLRTDDPDAFAAFSTTERSALASYENAKTAATEAGVDTTAAIAAMQADA